MWRKEGVINRQFGKGIIISEGVNSYGDGPERYVGELYKATQADERLIIAARDLLKALVDLNADILPRVESNASGNPEWEYVSERINAARAAIAKAKGETK